MVGLLARVLASRGTTNGIPPGTTVNIQEIGREDDWLNISLTRQERATLSAALRYYQHEGQGEPCNRSDDIHDLATCGGDEISLDDAGIDELCAQLNFAKCVLTVAPPTKGTRHECE
jgi:hypothetical protein